MFEQHGVFIQQQWNRSHADVSEWERRGMWRTAEPLEMFVCLSLFVKMMFLPKLTKAGISIPTARQCRQWKNTPDYVVTPTFLANAELLNSGKDLLSVRQ